MNGQSHQFCGYQMTHMLRSLQLRCHCWSRLEKTCATSLRNAGIEIAKDPNCPSGHPSDVSLVVVFRGLGPTTGQATHATGCVIAPVWRGKQYLNFSKHGIGTQDHYRPKVDQLMKVAPIGQFRFRPFWFPWNGSQEVCIPTTYVWCPRDPKTIKWIVFWKRPLF